MDLRVKISSDTNFNFINFIVSSFLFAQCFVHIVFAAVFSA